jgi:hypothetical protein
MMSSADINEAPNSFGLQLNALLTAHLGRIRPYGFGRCRNRRAQCYQLIEGIGVVRERGAGQAGRVAPVLGRESLATSHHYSEVLTSSGPVGPSYDPIGTYWKVPPRISTDKLIGYPHNLSCYALQKSITSPSPKVGFSKRDPSSGTHSASGGIAVRSKRVRGVAALLG